MSEEFENKLDSINRKLNFVIAALVIVVLAAVGVCSVNMDKQDSGIEGKVFDALEENAKAAQAVVEQNDVVIEQNNKFLEAMGEEPVPNNR